MDPPKYRDQTKNFDVDHWKKAIDTSIEGMKSRRKWFMAKEKEMFERNFPNESWSTYENEIKEAEQNFTKADRIYFDDELQNKFEEFWYLKEKSAASSERFSKLVKK